MNLIQVEEKVIRYMISRELSKTQLLPIPARSRRELNLRVCNEHVSKCRARGSFKTSRAREEQAGIL